MASLLTHMGHNLYVEVRPHHEAIVLVCATCRCDVTAEPTLDHTNPLDDLVMRVAEGCIRVLLYQCETGQLLPQATLVRVLSVLSRTFGPDGVTGAMAQALTLHNGSTPRHSPRVATSPPQERAYAHPQT
jgi:hypothetical protein